MKTQHRESKIQNWKPTVFGMGGVLGILLLLYITGWHREIRSKLQQGLLWTGLLQADTSLSVEEKVPVDYNMLLISLERGEKSSLSDFRGKVIFLNFWASWCGPCRVEMPHIQALYEQYQDKAGIKFVMVSLDEEPEKARRFLKEQGYTFGSYRLAGERPAELQTTVIPATFVISREGIIVSKHTGIANYNTSGFRAFLDTLLKE